MGIVAGERREGEGVAAGGEEAQPAEGMEGIGVGSYLFVAEGLALIGGNEPFGTLRARSLDANLVATFFSHVNGPREARGGGEVGGALLEVPLAELRHPLELLHGAALGSGTLGEKEGRRGAADENQPLPVRASYGTLTPLPC